MRHPSLSLYAAAPNAAIRRAALVECLESLGLIGRAIDTHSFFAGDAFFRQIIFLGCSPSIPLSPEQGEHFIRIQLHCSATPRLLSSERAHTPMCRSCKFPLSDWQRDIQSSTDATIVCPACRSRLEVSALNFRKRACYSQSIIQIQPIYESEAVPDVGLLQLLQQQFNTVFKYAYT